MSHHVAPTMVARSPLHHASDQKNEETQKETITLRTRGGDQVMDVLVLSKRGDRIQIMLQEGAHSVFCELKPTPDASAYAGTSLGREIVYERSRKDVEADIAGRVERKSDAPSW